jgi:hypothetical protein
VIITEKKGCLFGSELSGTLLGKMFILQNLSVKHRNSVNVYHGAGIEVLFEEATEIRQHC